MTSTNPHRDALTQQLLELCSTAGALRSALGALPASRARRIAETHFDTLDLATLDVANRLSQEELEVTVALALTSLRAAQLWTEEATRAAAEVADGS